MTRRQRSMGATPKRRRVGTQSTFCSCLPSVINDLRGRQSIYRRQGKSHAVKRMDRRIRAVGLMMLHVCQEKPS